MDRESFKSWLDSYGRPWIGRDPVAAAALYTDHATYQVTPFSEPLRGRAAIYEYWDGVAKTEERIQFDCEIPRRHYRTWYREVAGVVSPCPSRPGHQVGWNLFDLFGREWPMPLTS